jgi:hypothetical protein
VGCNVFSSVEEAVEHMVHSHSTIEPDMKDNALYSEEYEIFKQTLELLIHNGIYDKIASFQNRYAK